MNVQDTVKEGSLTYSQTNLSVKKMVRSVTEKGKNREKSQLDIKFRM